MKSYLQLVRAFSLRPLRSQAELDRAVKIIDALLDQETLGPDERDYLDVLGLLVESFEEETCPLDEPLSDADMLRHLLDAKDVTQAALARATGIPESVVSEVLAGKRRLNRRHIEKLSRYFAVSPNVFFNPAPAARRSRRPA